MLWSIWSTFVMCASKEEKMPPITIVRGHQLMTHSDLREVKIVGEKNVHLKTNEMW